MSLAAVVVLCSGLVGVVLVPVITSGNSNAEPLLHAGNRTLWVVVAAAATRLLQPQLGLSEFYGWLMFFYLDLLVLEVIHLSRGLRKQAGRQSSSSSH